MLSLLAILSTESCVHARMQHDVVNMGIQDVDRKANMANFTRKDELEIERDKYKADASNAFDREGLRQQADQAKLEELKENNPIWQERRNGDKKIIIIVLCVVAFLTLLIIICCCRRKYLRKRAEERKR